MDGHTLSSDKISQDYINNVTLTTTIEAQQSIDTPDVIINGPPTSLFIHNQLKEGMEKHLVVLWKPQYCNERITLYNEELVPIVDLSSLHKANIIYCTNQTRRNSPLTGKRLVEGRFIIKSSRYDFTGKRLILIDTKQPDNRYTFRDGYTLEGWRNNNMLNMNNIYVFIS